MDLKERCTEKVTGAGRFGGVFDMSRCSRKGSVEREGKLYCKIHDPIARKLKDEKRQEIWQEKWDRDIRKMEFSRYAEDVCKDVPTEKLKELGTGWLVKYLAEKV